METISRFALIFLLNSLWQVTALVLVAAVCSRLLGKAPASHRNMLWTMTLALGLLLPLLSAAGISASEISWPFSKAAEALTGARATSTSASTAWLEEILRGKSPSVAFAPSLLSAVAAVYLLFLLYRALRLWQAWRKTAEISRNAHSYAFPEATIAIAERCRIALRLTKVSILSSSNVEGPVTLGARRAEIVLPLSLLETASPEVLTSALGHEMAHIRRRDFLLNFLCELISLPISFHPATGYGKRRLRETREVACDEMVVERLISPKEYARSLVCIANSMATFDNPTYSLGIFDASNLEERIMKLTQRSPRASERLAKALLVTAVFALALSAVAASAFSVSAGQNKGAESTKSIAGNWLLFPKEEGKSEEGPRITVVLYSNDGRLTGKVIHHWKGSSDGSATEMKAVEWALTDIQFDGTNLSFRVYPPDKDDPSRSHYLEGKLKLEGDEFVGKWTSSENQSGSLKMIRNKD